MKERVKILRKQLRLTQTEFGNKLGISMRGVQKWENGESIPQQSSLLLLKQVFNVNPDWIINGSGDMFLSQTDTYSELDIVNIPYYPEVFAAAGSGALVYDENTVRQVKISSALINIHTGDNICIINATGSSMQPVIHDSDLLLVDLAKKSITDEGIYVIRLDTTLVVKRVQKILHGVILISENPQYPPKELSADNFNENDAAVIGKVIAVIKNFNKNII